MGPSCTLTCSATVPTTGTASLPNSFASTATASNCTGVPVYSWVFGDGGTSAQQNPTHTYAAMGTYTWDLTVNVDGETCTQSGSIAIAGFVGSSVICTLNPSIYTPGQGVLVTIIVTPYPTVSVFAVEDAPPSGWTISGINESGFWDSVNGKVKWGPFFDSFSRTLQYTATPPPGETGTKTFAGVGSFDGTSIAIWGDRTISPGAPSCTLSCSATVPGTGTVGTAVSFAATATATNCTGVPAYAWTFGDGGSSAQQNPSHTYASAGTFTWNLAVTVDAETCTQSGSITVAGAGSTAICTFSPTAYTPGQGGLVTIVVTPDPAVGVYAVEDSPPMGWAISAISGAGSWDAANEKVKWGPFFDSTPRTLQYTATPPIGENKTQTFVGVASLDGSSIPITGDRTIAPAGGTVCVLTCSATVPGTGSAGSAVSFAATATAVNCLGTPAYSWTFGDGGTSAQQNPTHTYAVDGTYNWSLTVTVDGEICTQSGTITVAAVPTCVLSCTASANPTSGSAPLGVAFAATASTSSCAGTPTFSWNFGDGGTSSQQNPSHTFTSDGTYAWTVTIAVDGRSCASAGTVVVGSGGGPCLRQEGRLPSGGTGGVAVSGSTCWFGTGVTLRAVDISTPSNPQEVGSLDLPGTGVGPMVLNGTTGYVANLDQGLAILDLSDPANPALLSSTPMDNMVRRLDVEGTLVALDDDGLQLVDVADPQNPVKLGKLDMQVSDIDISGSYAYVASGVNGLVVVDISNTANPTARIAPTSPDADSFFIFHPFPSFLCLAVNPDARVHEDAPTVREARDRHIVRERLVTPTDQ